MPADRLPRGRRALVLLKRRPTVRRGRGAATARLADFRQRHADAVPALLERLQRAVIDDAGVFEVPIDAARGCSLGQITAALSRVGGQCRRSL